MRNYEIYEKLDLEYTPVAVKFSMTKPADLPLLTEKKAMCEMLHHCQTIGGFYADVNSHGCGVGPHILGQKPVDDPGMVGGMIGPRIGVYEDTRGNAKVYENMITFPKGIAPYTWFAPLKEATFKPDLVIMIAKAANAEVILRAYGYYTGKGWNAYGTSVAGCACLYTRPFFTGELNVMITGLHHGMRARGTYPAGLLMISVPYQVLPGLTDALEEMTWDLPQYHWGPENHKKYMGEIGKKIAEDLNA